MRFSIPILRQAAAQSGYNLTRMSVLLRCSVRTLERNFEQLGHRHSPRQVLFSWRMESAANLLKTQPLRIKEVSAKVGFDSASSFSRAFRRNFGCAPIEFQSRHQAEFVPAALLTVNRFPESSPSPSPRRNAA